MADYPDTIYTPRTFANKPGNTYDAAKTTRLFAEDQNETNDEIIALETDLLITKPPSFTKIETGIYLRYLTACKLLLSFLTPSDNGTETDQSGLSHDAIYFPDSGWSASALKNKGLVHTLAFDGNDFLTIPDTDDLSFGDGAIDSAFSIGFWLNSVHTGLTQTIIAKYDQTTDSPQPEWWFRKEPDNTLRFLAFDQSAAKLTNRLTNAAISSGWHFIVLTYNPTAGSGETFANGLTIYVDGSAVPSTAGNQADYVAMENTAVDVSIGSNKNTAGIYRYFLLGDLGRLFITKETLTAATIWKMYQETRGFYNV